MGARVNRKRTVVVSLAVFTMVILLPSLSIAGKRLEVMGFYLGMNVNDAVKNIKKLGIDNYQVISTGVSFGQDLGNWLQIDNDNKVNYILFTYRLFDAQDLSLNDFIKKFTLSYHIPLKYDSMRDTYFYQTSDCEVLIPSDPGGIVIIHKNPKPEFNVNG